LKTIESELFLHRITLKRDAVPSFEEYPFSLPVVRGLNSLELTTAVTFFIGENGSGKSTLLEAIAIASGFNPEGGSKNFNFETYSAHSNLHKFLRITKTAKRAGDGFFLRAESFFNVASEIEHLGVTQSYGGTSLHAQSHGESFLALLNHRFRGNGVYLLDEPEAALSPNRQLVALSRIHELVEKGSQFIIATHSPIMMSYPGSAIFSVENGEIRSVEYEDTEHVRVTRQFLNHPNTFLAELFRK
jgi:predicted ATPase